MIKSSELRQGDVCSKRKTNVHNKPLWLRIWNVRWNSFNIFTWQPYELQFEQHKIPLIFLHTDVRHLLPPRLPQADVNGLNCFLFLGLRLILSSNPFFLCSPWICHHTTVCNLVQITQLSLRQQASGAATETFVMAAGLFDFGLCHMLGSRAGCSINSAPSFFTDAADARHRPGIIQLTSVQLNFSPALYLPSFDSLKQMNCIKWTVLASTGKSIEWIV